MHNRVSKNNATTTKKVTCVMGIPEGEEREKGREEIFKKMMSEHFLK